MKNAGKRTAAVVAAAGMTACAWPQVPDLISAFEMGGRGMGMGGALYSNASDASASYWNPAGLGHIDRSQAEINFRNRPSTTTTLSGTFVDPDRSGEVKYGSNSISFGGFAVPVGGGTIGLSYAVGGYAREFAEGRNLTSGDPNDPTNVDPRREFLRVVNEFVTLGWGMKRGAGLNAGAGIVFARQFIGNAFFEIVRDGQGNEIGRTETDVNETGSGIGGIVGVQFSPPNNPGLSAGVSYRSEIKIEGLGDASAFSEAIPARAQGGVIWRLDGLRGGRDYLIGGVDAAYFFKANSGKILERDGQLSAGFGFEYNWAQSFGYLPVRFGFRTTQAAGDNFAARDVFTFGVGYRPEEANYWLDFNLATGGGQSSPDVAVSMSFLIGK